MGSDLAESGRVREAAVSLSRVERLIVVLLCMVVLVAIVPYGATGVIAMPVALLAASVWCIVATLAAGRGWPSISLVSLAIAGLLGAYMLLQASREMHLLPPSQSFARAATLLGATLSASASIGPGRTMDAIAPILVPLVLFGAACRLLRTDLSAIWVLRFLSWSGGAVALLGILQHLFAPDVVLLSRKTSYIGDLTAVFVNRNTAATFLGGSALVSVAVVAYDIGRRPTWKTLLALAASDQLTRRDWAIALHASIAITALAALLLTSSRAGTAASLVAVTLLISLLFRNADTDRRARARSPWTFMRRWTLVLLTGSGIAVLFGSRTLDRALTQGTEDGRFCVFPDIWRLAGTTWPWGSGAGTFELAFRPLRDPACGIHGVWDRAHSFFLEGLVVLGAPFLAVAVLGLGALAVTLRRGWRQRRQFRAGPALGSTFLVLVILHDLVDFSIQIPGISLWAATVLAACCALCERKQVAA